MTKVLVKKKKIVPDKDGILTEKEVTIMKSTCGSLSDKLAGSSIVKLYWYYPEGASVFPNEPMYWYVEKFYPYALCGTLCVDEPIDYEEIEKCKVKAEHLAKHKLPYVWLRRGMSFDEALAQLKEHLEKCGLQRS